MTHDDPVREGEDFIEIDERKKKWPFLRIHADMEDPGRFFIMIDCNKAGQVVGEGVGIAAVSLSRKKMKHLRDFLDRVLDE